MIFLEAFLWGTGLSLGMCVGLVAWVFLRTALHKVLGITEDLNEHLQINRDSLAELRGRNDLTVETNGLLERIALAIELADDDWDDDSEEWKNGNGVDSSE